MDVKTKIAALRTEIEKQDLDGFIVPHADEYLNEYLPANAERLAWLTGFTGSNGIAVILKDKAIVLTDSRYTLQIAQQVDKTFYETGDLATLTVGDWLAAEVKGGEKIGFDPCLHTRKQIGAIIEKTKEKKTELVPVKENPVNLIWTDRPEAPWSLVEIFPDDVAGKTSVEKRQEIANALKAEKISAVIVTQCDSVCWLLNVRGSDIPYNPVILSNLVLYADGRADWYVDASKVPADVSSHLGRDIRICSPEEFEKDLTKLKGPVQIDPQRSPLVAETILKERGIGIVDGKDPCVGPKSIKTPAEQLAIKQAHIRDGVAVTQFLDWLDCQDVSKDIHTELSLAEKLEEFRQGQEGYRGQSFATISGWAENGAIIHYHTSPENNKRVKGNGFYLLDSGGQYEYGTTDITRTIAIGKITAEMKDRFTRVLKGHIAVASAVMDDTMTGAALDALARTALNEAGLDFGHSTGHGVGCMLPVHEEATYISSKVTDATFKAGMLLSNEPGFYLEGQYGIRLENLILCHEREDGKLCWETVTLAPFDLRAVDWSLITAPEKEWLLTYHTQVFEILKPFLHSEAVDWLQDVCFSYFED